MFAVVQRFQHTILGLLFLGVWATNAFVLQEETLGVLLLGWFVAMVGTWTGSALVPGEHPAIRWWMGTWIAASVVMLVGSTAYYLASYPPALAQILILLAVPFGLLVLHRKTPRGWFERAHDLFSEHAHHVPAAAWFASGASFLFLLLVLRTFSLADITEPVRSLWLNVPPSVFVGFGLAGVLLVGLLVRGRERALAIPLVCVALFTLLSAALLAFPIGYGFDPFIHRATEAHIAEHGTITPKPLYYIGQYALVLFAYHGFSVSVEHADLFLVPILASLLLPLAWYTAAAHLLRDRRSAAASLIGLFLLPLSSFIVTTPQGLANLWTLLLFLAATPFLVGVERPRLWTLLVPALAALAIHPIAGLPALIFVCLLASEPLRANANIRPFARALFWTIALLGCIALPASFAINALRSGIGGLDLSGLTPATLLEALHLDLFLENRFNPILDFVYLYGFNASWIVAVGALAAAWRFRKEETRVLRSYLVLAAILLANFAILSTAVDFSFLISYERSGYAERLIPLMLFALAPLFLLGLGRLSTALRESPFVLRAGAGVLAAALVTSSFYLAYPRHDSYAVSRGFNVGATDVDAVHAIEKDAGTTSHVVLANQSVSAAALREFGFAHYYGEAFFYPIPTGSELYTLFLTMNEQPTREIAERAAALTNASCAAARCTEASVKSVYYVVNDYWWQAERLVETGKQTADRWFSVGDGAVHVFRYDIER